MNPGRKSARPSSQSNWRGVDVRVASIDSIDSNGTSSHVLACTRPTLHLVLEEIGGRAELRVPGPRGPDPLYYGPLALGFTAGGSALVLECRRARSVRLASFTFCIPEVAEISPAFSQAMETSLTCTFPNDERVRDCAALLAAECERGGKRPNSYGSGIALALIASTAELLAKGVGSPQLSSRDFALAAGRIERDLAKSITTEDLSNALAMPSGNIVPLFKFATGMTPGRWQMRERIMAAQRMLLDDSTRSLVDIARDLGFADQSHFTRTFKGIAGVGPKEWARRIE